MHCPRILLAAPSSGSGKTMLTCGLLRLLCRKGKRPAAFKCGPDYIDPMFHRKVLGVDSGNLDTYFAGREGVKKSFLSHSRGADISVIEGVMGYYDGIGGTTWQASAYDVAGAIESPVILVVDSKGMSLSLIPLIKGFVEYEKESRIAGVIFNRMNPMVYQRVAPIVEEQLGILALGYVPVLKDVSVESRHLGLVLPGELSDIQERIDRLAEELEKTLDWERIIALAGKAPDLEDALDLEKLLDLEEAQDLEKLLDLGETPALEETPAPCKETQAPLVRVGIAMDGAFCFYYRDNLDLLRSLGVELVPFRPTDDTGLPEGIRGLLLGGGYPELYVSQLSANTSMRKAIGESLRAGMPALAECGGFLYLHESLEDEEGRAWPMAGVFPAKGYRTDRLGRFGYIEVQALKDTAYLNQGQSIRAHEFHYWDSTLCGADFHAAKPSGGKGWDCIHGQGNLMAGFPHLYYPSCPGFAERFVEQCRRWRP